MMPCFDAPVRAGGICSFLSRKTADGGQWRSICRLIPPDNHFVHRLPSFRWLQDSVFQIAYLKIQTLYPFLEFLQFPFDGGEPLKNHA